jgi:phage anti-repressor protein
MQDYATCPLQLAIVENSASDSSSNYDLMFTKTKEIPVILREGRSRKWRRRKILV